MTEAMKKEKQKTIDKIEGQDQIDKPIGEFPEIDEIASDDQDPSELTSGTDERDDKGSGEPIEPVVKDERFSRGHVIDEQALRKNAKKTDTTPSVPDPSDEPEVDEEETETE
jgi:hypothetical protein